MSIPALIHPGRNYICLFAIGLLVFFNSCEDSRPAERKIKGNNLISHAHPEGIIKVNPDLMFLADTSFVLKGNSNTEIYYFTDQSMGEVNKYLLLQFETFLPDVEGSYEYEPADSLVVGDVGYIWNYWCFDQEMVAKYVPDSDVAAGQKMLKAHGVTTPGTYVGVRLIHLSADKRSESLVIYGENVNVRGVDCEDEESALPLMEKIYEEALGMFEIE